MMKMLCYTRPLHTHRDVARLFVCHSSNRRTLFRFPHLTQQVQVSCFEENVGHITIPWTTHLEQWIAVITQWQFDFFIIGVHKCIYNSVIYSIWVEMNICHERRGFCPQFQIKRKHTEDSNIKMVQLMRRLKS